MVARSVIVQPMRFAPSLIRALEEDRKGATRRIVTSANSLVQPGKFENLRLETGRASFVNGRSVIKARCGFPAGERAVTVESRIKPFDLLWVRRGQQGGTRVASSMTLEVWAVEVSRLQDMTEQDAIDEGVWHPDPAQFPEAQPEACSMLWYPCAEKGKAHISPRLAFRDLWTSLNGRGRNGWDANPWVWTYRFTVHRMNVDQLLEVKKSA